MMIDERWAMSVDDDRMIKFVYVFHIYIYLLYCCWCRWVVIVVVICRRVRTSVRTYCVWLCLCWWAVCLRRAICLLFYCFRVYLRIIYILYKNKTATAKFFYLRRRAHTSLSLFQRTSRQLFIYNSESSTTNSSIQNFSRKVCLFVFSCILCVYGRTILWRKSAISQWIECSLRISRNRVWQ